MRSILLRFTLLLTAAAAGACRDAPVTPRPGPARSVAVAPTPDTLPVIITEPEVFGRFAVHISADGRLVPGAPVRLTATAVVALPAADAELTLTTPDLDELTARNAGAPGLARGTPVSARGRVRSGAVQGGHLTSQAVVTFPEPGYYRVTATAATRSTERQVADDTRSVQDITQGELWLWVTETGGSITSTFRRDLFPDSIVPAPGPFRTIPGLRVLARPRDGLPVVAPATLQRGALQGTVRDAGATGATPSVRPTVRPQATRQVPRSGVTANDVPAGQRRVTVQYVSSDDPFNPNVVTPLVGAQYTTQVYHAGGGECPGFEVDCGNSPYWEQIDGGVTDANGSLTTVCAYGGDVQSIDVTVYASAPNAATVQGGAAVAELGWTSDFSCPGGNDIAQTVNDNSVAGVFMHISRAIVGSRAQFQPITRGPLNVKVDGSTNISAYSAGSDEITIAASGSNNAVWGGYGVFTAAHEYGHALHEKALGGIFHAQNCPSGGHQYGVSTNGGCAFAEGFADYHGTVAVLASGGLYSYWESAVLNHATNRDPSTGNPSQDELPIASFLYDLSNQLGTQFVAGTVRDCRLTYFYSVTPGSGTTISNQRAGNSSGLTWCFERQVDSGADNYYFGTELWTPIGFQSSTAPPTNWSQPLVRQSWLHDIFLQ